MSIKPKLTDEQRKELEALLMIGFNWVAKDKSGDVYEYVDKPKRDDWEWYGDVIALPMLSCLAPLLPNWRIPLDIEKTLREEQI